MSTTPESSPQDAAQAEQEAVERLAEAAQECCGAWGEQVRSLGDTAAEFIRSRPIQSLLVAAGVGLLVGLSLRKR